MSRSLGCVFESTSQSGSEKEKRKDGVDMTPAQEEIWEQNSENWCVLPGEVDPALVGSADVVRKQHQFTRHPKLVAGAPGKVEGTPSLSLHPRLLLLGSTTNAKTLPSLNTRLGLSVLL